MASSTSSDDEDLDKLREAVDTKFINDSMFGKSKDDGEIESRSDKIRLPSLRPVKDDQEQFNLLSVTPEFQKYVAKCLGEHIERKLGKRLASVDIEHPSKKRRKKGGIKLFRDSKEYLSLKNESCVTNASPSSKKVKVMKRTTENDDISDNVKIKLCAVNSDDILSKKDIKYWKEHRKSEVFEYKCDKNGKLVYVEKQFE